MTQVCIVFDKYHPNSTKDATHEKRGAYAQTFHILENATIPTSWQLILKNGENKANLAAFYTEYMILNIPKSLEDGQCYFISGGDGDNAIKISQGNISRTVPELASNLEEADGRIALHAITASNLGAQRIVVESPDTDVLVLLVHYWPLIKANEVYFLTGKTTNFQKNT